MEKLDENYWSKKRDELLAESNRLDLEIQSLLVAKYVTALSIESSLLTSAIRVMGDSSEMYEVLSCLQALANLMARYETAERPGLYLVSPDQDEF